ncbi:hypothetical protein AAVH_24323 [Aphelenchoides avenae]|nr:hypothetical protein AAVH_24323 [Aphelenchus avenae]
MQADGAHCRISYNAATVSLRRLTRSPELMLEVFRFLERSDLDACEFTSTTWFRWVREQSAILARRKDYTRVRPFPLSARVMASGATAYSKTFGILVLVVPVLFGCASIWIIIPFIYVFAVEYVSDPELPSFMRGLQALILFVLLLVCFNFLFCVFCDFCREKALKVKAWQKRVIDRMMHKYEPTITDV